MSELGETMHACMLLVRELRAVPFYRMRIIKEEDAYKHSFTSYHPEKAFFSPEGGGDLFIKTDLHDVYGLLCK